MSTLGEKIRLQANVALTLASNLNLIADEADTWLPPSGQVTVLVPFVVGLTQAAANAAIVAAGLVVGATGTASSGTVAAGLVISQTPPAGTVVARGSPVAVTVSTGVGTGCPVIANMPPKGTQWHADFRSPSPRNHARANLDWMMSCYGSSWAWAYMVRSATQLSNDVMAAYGSEEGGRIIGVFAGQQPPPQGVLVPTAGSVKPNPTRYTSLSPNCSVPLPYPDDWA